MAKRKKQRTAKQKAAFKKMRAGLARWKKKNPNRRKVRRKVARKVGRRVVARGARKVGRRVVGRRTVRKVRRKVARKAPAQRVTRRRGAPKLGPFFIKRGVRFFDGAGFNRDRRVAASFTSMPAAKRIADKIARVTGGAVSIHG